MLSIPNLIKRKLLPKSLLTRFTMIIIIPTLVGQLIAIYLFYQRHWYNVSHHNSNLIATEISSLLHTQNYSEAPNKKRTYLNLEYVFAPKSGIPEVRKKHIEEIVIFKKVLKREIGQNAIINLKPNGDIQIYIKVDNNLLQIKLPYKSLLNPTTSIFVWWIIFLTILLLSISLIFLKNQVKSIIELTNAAENYGRSDKTICYAPSGAKEIRRAGLAFLKMKERIERQTAKRTQMLAMISHDLKTPLTRMKLQVELMKNSEEKDELSYDIQSMQHMISSYLDFARGEGGENFDEIDINKWIRKYIKNKWSKHNIKITANTTPSYTRIKHHSFERAIDNLISNALKYSTKIEISLYEEKNNVFINIEDNGEGIEESERSLVFKPFYRSDKSRPLKHFSSVGLGLSITKEIITGHYGTIILSESKKLKGLMVTIQLPLQT